MSAVNIPASLPIIAGIGHFLRVLAAFAGVLLLWILDSRVAAGSSVGSWGTSSPLKALSRRAGVSLSIWARAV
jgi:hypothetical protein